MLKKDGWVPPPAASGTRVQLEVREPVTTRLLTIMAVERWLTGAVRNPAEKMKKERLKAMLR